MKIKINDKIELDSIINYNETLLKRKRLVAESSDISDEYVAQIQKSIVEPNIDIKKIEILDDDGTVLLSTKMYPYLSALDRKSIYPDSRYGGYKAILMMVFGEKPEDV